MRIIDCDQNTPEWFETRRGIPTCSNFDKIITSDGKPSKQAQKYMYQLAGEAVTGIKEESYQNAAMQRGIELEPEARAFYEMVKDVSVQQVGFCLTDCGFGGSPDGLVGDDGLVEIKCPSLAVAVSYLLDGKLPTEYFQQVHGLLLVTGRAWCDFVSYYPGLKPLIVRVKRDKEFNKRLKIELEIFCNELKNITKKLED